MIVAPLNAISGERSFIDESPQVFLPNKLGGTLESYNSFPATWWNFIVVSYKKTPSDLQLDQGCKDISKILKFDTSFVVCGTSINQYHSVILEWSRNSIYREPAPSLDAIKYSFNSAITKFAYATGDMGSVLKDIFKE